MVNPENYFYVCNGVVMKDLDDLLNLLNSIDNETFNHHVNDEKNDFFYWVRDAVQDKVLAKKLERTKKRSKMIEYVDKRVNTEIRKRTEIISQIKGAIKG